MIARAIRLLLASGFLAAVTHVAPVAERAALGITRVEDLARPRRLPAPWAHSSHLQDRPALSLARKPEREWRRMRPRRTIFRCAGTAARHPAQPPLTPGAVRTADPGDVCGDRSTRQYRHWSRARDDRILAEYGLPAGPHPDFEIDHLISLDLGGADDDANLWPEPRRSIEPARGGGAGEGRGSREASRAFPFARLAPFLALHDRERALSLFRGIPKAPWEWATASKLCHEG